MGMIIHQGESYSGSDAIDTTMANNVVTYEISTSNWVEDTTSQSGTTLYKKQVLVNHVYAESPEVSVGSSSGSVLPTVDQQSYFDLLRYVTVDSAVPCIYLYASETPAGAFYINVEGVD